MNVFTTFHANLFFLVTAKKKKTHIHVFEHMHFEFTTVIYCVEVLLPVSLKEVSVAGRFPPDCRVYSVVGNISTIIHQLHRIALLQVGLPEEPESVSWGEERKQERRGEERRGEETRRGGERRGEEERGEETRKERRGDLYGPYIYIGTFPIHPLS